MPPVRPSLLATILCPLLAAFAAPVSAQTPAELARTHRVGGLKIGVFTATSSQSNGPAMTVSIPAPWKIIGGGARAVWTPAMGGGMLLTASRPDSDRTWFAAATGHRSPVLTRLEVVIVAAQYFDREARRWAPLPPQTLQIASALSPGKSGGQAAASVQLAPPFVVTGGGFSTHYEGRGLLVHTSVPTAQGWTAASSEHLDSSHGKLRVAAIGLHRGLLSYCRVAVRRATQLAPRPEPMPRMQLSVPGAAVVVGGGGRLLGGSGNFLVKAYPDSPTSFALLSKDHFARAHRRLEGHAIGLVDLSGGRGDRDDDRGRGDRDRGDRRRRNR